MQVQTLQRPQPALYDPVALGLAHIARAGPNPQPWGLYTPQRSREHRGANAAVSPAIDTVNQHWSMGIRDSHRLRAIYHRARAELASLALAPAECQSLRRQPASVAAADCQEREA